MRYTEATVHNPVSDRQAMAVSSVNSLTLSGSTPSPSVLPDSTGDSHDKLANTQGCAANRLTLEASNQHPVHMAIRNFSTVWWV